MKKSIIVVLGTIFTLTLLSTVVVAGENSTCEAIQGDSISAGKVKTKDLESDKSAGSSKDK